MGEGKEPSFGWLVIARAWQGTLETFETTWRAIVLAIAVAAASLVVQFFHSGRDAMMADLWQTAWQTTLPILVVGGLVLLWNLWIAPSALAYEAARTALAHSRVLQPSSAPAPVEDKVNWSIWKHRASFNLKEFARVLAKIDPALDEETPTSSGFLKLVQEDAVNRKLPVTRDRNAENYYQPDLWPYYFDVAKADAIKWAKGKDFDISHIEGA